MPLPGKNAKDRHELPYAIAAKFSSVFSGVFAEKRLPLKITALYLVAGTAWAFAFGNIHGPEGTVEDLLFLSFAAAPLYWLIDHGMKAIRRSEGALRESEKRLAGILETNPSGVVLFDDKAIVAYANSAASNILGVKRSDLAGRSYGEMGWEIATADGMHIPEEDRMWNRTFRNGDPVSDMECVISHPGGNHLILSFSSAPLLDAAGGIAGIVVAFIDITERKKAQDLNLRKLSLVVEQSPAAIVITDIQSRIEYVNPQFTRLTGYSQDEVLGTRNTTVCNQSHESCAEVCGSISSKGEWKGEQKSFRKYGASYWEKISVSPMRDKEGMITHYIWIREDVTEHRMADEALAESRGKFQSLVETVNDWVWEIDENLVFSYVSPKTRDILGYEPEEILGKSPFELMSETEARRIRTGIRDVIAGRKIFEHLEGEHRHRDGTSVFLDVSGVPFFAPDGTFRGWRGVARDITKRKRAEEELRESEERFRQLFEQAEEPIILFDSGTARVLDANPAAEAVYGYSREELVRDGPSLFVDAAGLAEFEAGIRGIGGGNAISFDKLRHLRRDGERIVVSVRGKSICLKDGPVSYCTFRDITERVRLEEEAKIQQAKLIHANRMTALGTIVSGVAHEVSNPNSLIMFNAPLLMSVWRDALPILREHHGRNGEFPLGGVPFTEVQSIVPRLLQDIAEASRRIKEIVGTLKDFSRQDKRRPDELIDPNAIVRTAVAILRHEITKHTRNFHTECADGLPLVKGWKMELEQVVINLIVNSLQALPNPARGVYVSTSWNRERGRVEIRVRDEGTGMSGETMARLAEPFFSTKLDSGGLGLGLSISQTILKEHDGTLTFRSEVGNGTVACVELPPALAVAVPNPGEAGRDEARN